MSTEGTPVDRRDPDFHGAGLADALLIELQNSTDIRDRVLLAIAEEADRLEALIGNMGKASLKAQAATRRVQALKILHETLATRDEKQKADRPIQIIAGMLRNLRDTLNDLNVPAEMKETILQSLMHRVEEAPAKERKGLPQAS